MQLLNDEQILELCLIAISYDYSKFEGYAGEFITYYVIKNYSKENEIMPLDEIVNNVNKIMSNYLIESLVKKGEIECFLKDDGETEIRKTVNYGK